MGNTTSTLMVASADTSIDGLYAYTALNNDLTFTRLTNDVNTRSNFNFDNGNSPSLWSTGDRSRPIIAIYDQSTNGQNLIFSRNGKPISSAYSYYQCYGNKQTSTIQCGGAQNIFYACEKGNNAYVQIGSTVPGGCSQLSLVWRQ